MWQRCTLVFLLIFLPIAGFAQVGNFQSLGSGAQPPSIALNPSFPGPGEPFTASIENFSSTLFGSQITWTYNGEVIEVANNQRSVELSAGAAGSDNQIAVTLNTPRGETQNITRTLNPIYIDIIFEPQTRVPDWYMGRALPSYTSQVNATALLHNGTEFIDPNNIVYSWQVEQTMLEGGTIRGANKVSFDTPRGSEPIVIVTASDVRGNTIARRGMKMTSVQPEIAYYEKHSLYGMKTLPLQSSSDLVGNVLTIQAEPFHLDSRVYNQPDIATWEINNIETDNGTTNPYEITLSRAGVGGQTVLNFHVRSLREILQGAEDDIRVNF